MWDLLSRHLRTPYHSAADRRRLECRSRARAGHRASHPSAAAGTIRRERNALSPTRKPISRSSRVDGDPSLAPSGTVRKAGVAGHDIGLMVAYAYAAQYPAEVDRIALLDAFIPGVGDTTNLFLLKDLWHFHFYGKTPLALVDGRERVYFEHFWNDFAADSTKSVSEADRQFYTKKYKLPGAMKAGMEVVRNFDQDTTDNAAFQETKLTMPMLVLGGEKSGGDFLITQARWSRPPSRV
jgi:pimeloyl-ACP methyl ester carboxylesterase